MTETFALAMTEPDDVMVSGIILAVVEHRRRIAKLLDRLDGERRALVEISVAALEEGTVDVATLLARFHDGATCAGSNRSRTGHEALHRVGYERKQMNARDHKRHALEWPLTRCPACHSERIAPVAVPHTDEVNFVCTDCRRRWHIELGYVRAV